MSSLKLIIYDLDGTLVDTRKDIADAANAMLEELGKSPVAETEVHRYVGKGLFYLIRGCLKSEDPKEVERAAKLYRKQYATRMLHHSCLYPGAKDVLDYFSSRIQAVITNKPEPFTTDILKALEVAHYFKDIIAGDSEYPKKPDPTSVQTLLKRGQVLPAEALFVGDSSIDIETARNAGVRIAVFPHGFTAQHELESHKPDFCVPSFQALLALARREDW